MTSITISHLPIHYISGPMTGKPNFNYAYFDEIAANLRAQGFTILSPSELGDGSQHDPDAPQKPYGYWLREAVKMLCRADRIIMIPGWTESKGARAEFAMALDCGMEAYLYLPDDDDVRRVF